VPEVGLALSGCKLVEQSSDGRIWILNRNSPGVRFFDGEAWQDVELPPKTSLAFHLMEDHEGVIWVSAGSALLEVNGSKAEVKHRHKELVFCDAGMEYNEMTSMCEPCERGFYKDNARPVPCTLCDIEYITAGTGANSSSECTVSKLVVLYRLVHCGQRG